MWYIVLQWYIFIYQTVLDISGWIMMTQWLHCGVIGMMVRIWGNSPNIAELLSSSNYYNIYIYIYIYYIYNLSRYIKIFSHPRVDRILICPNLLTKLGEWLNMLIFYQYELSIYLSIYLSLKSIYLSVYLSIYLAIYLSIYLYIYMFYTIQW